MQVMQVVVPYATNPKHGSPWALPAVQLALRQDGWEPQCLDLTGQETGYFDLVSELWSRRETVTIVEHDIVVWPGAIQDLENCSEDWCTYPYYCSLGWIQDGLGCTKFSGALMERYPEFFAEPYPTCCNHSKHYCGLDRFIAHRFEELEVKPHVHSPGVTNLNARWTV